MSFFCRKIRDLKSDIRAVGWIFSRLGKVDHREMNAIRHAREGL